jgi:hypothetical protein
MTADHISLAILATDLVLVTTAVVAADVLTTRAFMTLARDRGEDPTTHEGNRLLAKLVLRFGIGRGLMMYAPLQWVLFLLITGLFSTEFSLGLSNLGLGYLGIVLADVIMIGMFYGAVLRGNLQGIALERREIEEANRKTDRPDECLT